MIRKIFSPSPCYLLLIDLAVPLDQLCFQSLFHPRNMKKFGTVLSNL